MEKIYKILIVDDESSILNALERVLRRKDYNILKVLSADAAMPLLDDFDPDLIICDNRMPGMSGIDFLIHVNQTNRYILTILLTAHADLGLAVDAINRARLYKFIVKPWNDDDLRITIERALEQRDLIFRNQYLDNEVRKKDVIFKGLEDKYPGITRFKIDENGVIILDDEKKPEVSERG